MNKEKGIPAPLLMLNTKDCDIHILIGNEKTFEDELTQNVIALHKGEIVKVRLKGNFLFPLASLGYAGEITYYIFAK